jgi:tyrosine-protein phosphatase YwqE
MRLSEKKMPGDLSKSFTNYAARSNSTPYTHTLQNIFYIYQKKTASMFRRKNRPIPPHEFFPAGFVDIHSHLVPGIDDGAKDLNDSLDLIRQMAAYGVRDIITTPHIMAGVYNNTPGIILEKGEKLLSKQSELYGHVTQLPNYMVKLRFAAEYMLDEGFPKHLEEGLLTLKDNRVLVEMSYLSPPINLHELLFEMQMKEYEPVIAHPERYGFYHGNFKQYEKLKNRGCLFQMNLLSLTKQYGKGVQQTALRLLESGMVDFVGTDTHHVGHLNLWKEVSTERNSKLLEEVMERNVRMFRDSET